MRVSATRDHAQGLRRRRVCIDADCDGSLVTLEVPLIADNSRVVFLPARFADDAMGVLRGMLDAINLAAPARRYRTHGMSGAPEYRVWLQMIQRCENENCEDYPNYGGRGIKVCVRWRDSFEAFISDLGRRPSQFHSIDRVDNDRGYEPNNCRWATPSEQTANRRIS